MKKVLFALSLIAISQIVLAANMPGAQVLHTLKCGPKTTSPLGIQIELKVITQALAPEYSVRGISLVKKPVVPNAKGVETILKLDNQNAYNATFKAKNIVVLLDKQKFEATLNTGATEYECK